MADIWICNAVAKRRRSASDTFYENGLASLRGYLEDAKHTVRVIDWATEEQYARITPLTLARMSRNLAARLITAKEKGQAGLFLKLLLLIYLILQELQDQVLAWRMKRRLKQCAREVLAPLHRSHGLSRVELSLD